MLQIRQKTLVLINKILFICFLLIACKSPLKDVFGTETIRQGVILPYEIENNIFTKKSNSYGNFFNERNELQLYTYYNEDSKVLFQYNYFEDYFIGSPFIYCFDYFYNDTFTVICEVANPEKLDCHYFINQTEVIPDTNNLIFYKFRNASHNGKFEMKIMMKTKFKNKQWTNKINLKDSFYFIKENMIKHDLWNDYIP